ncbi:MAG: HlyD family efflux transporter periplasmic adaptor subunit [Gammaproteobacteria bacterium]|nr:HlyD family efflux transporter periplasmic adaptor subunit [Gammaproteobacteria bacterium]MDH4313195.1 HlyD family efflux transporter periplasmic adaptor subunit [Gammaproteobacteria bacterium]
MTRFAPLALSALLLVAGCARERPAEVHGTVERDRLELIAESNERIVDIAVREGDHVQPGAVLVRQEAGAAQPRIDQSRAALLEAQRRLADLEQGPRPREIDEARAALGGAESEFQTAQSEYARVQTLLQRQLLSQSNLDQARAARDSARAARDAARARYELLKQGTRTEQVAAARAAVQRAAAALAEVETVASRYTVTAPRAAVVEALPYKLGERPTAGRPVAILLADGVPYARVYVPEPLRTQFTAGTKVEAAVDGQAERVKGTVRYVSAEAAFTPYYALTQKDRSRLSFLAEITLDDPAAQALPAGMPIEIFVPAVQP